MNEYYKTIYLDGDISVSHTQRFNGLLSVVVRINKLCPNGIVDGWGRFSVVTLDNWVFSTRSLRILDGQH